VGHRALNVNAERVLGVASDIQKVLPRELFCPARASGLKLVAGDNRPFSGPTIRDVLQISLAVCFRSPNPSHERDRVRFYHFESSQCVASDDPRLKEK
jgi:hypothetical protein